MLLRWPFVLVTSVLSLLACAPPVVAPAATPAPPSTPAVATSPTATTTPPASPTVAAFVPGEILVLFKPGAAPSEIASLNNQYGATVLSIIPDFNLYHLKVAEAQVETVLDGYRGSPLVQAAQRNFIRQPILAPADTR